MKFVIKDLRLKKNLTQEELSEKSNVNRTTIAALENGHEVNVTIKTLKAIAKALDVTINDLFE